MFISVYVLVLVGKQDSKIYCKLNWKFNYLDFILKTYNLKNYVFGLKIFLLHILCHFLTFYRRAG